MPLDIVVNGQRPRSVFQRRRHFPATTIEESTFCSMMLEREIGRGEVSRVTSALLASTRGVCAGKATWQCERMVDACERTEARLSLI
jgi:hypothetical protein